MDRGAGGGRRQRRRAGRGRALARRRDGVLAYVVQGRFEHVNFIWRPAPLTGPRHRGRPAAPAEAAGHGRAGGRLRRGPAAGDAGAWTPWTCADMVAAHPAPHYLLPCRGSGVPAGGEVSFLDMPPGLPRPDWLLIGCERSAAVPRALLRRAAAAGRPVPAGQGPAAGRPGERVLTKCCLLERGIEVDGDDRGGAVGGEPGRGAGRAPRAVRPAPAGRCARYRPEAAHRRAALHDRRAPGRLGRLRPPVDHAGGIRAVLRRGPDAGLAAASWPRWPQAQADVGLVPRRRRGGDPRARRRRRCSTWAWSPSRPGPPGTRPSG